MPHQLSLRFLDGRFMICRLDPESPFPDWALKGEFVSITRTGDELSIVAAEADVPPNVRTDRGWRAFRVVGTQDFSMVGVLASLTAPLALAQISLFAISTFDTDYVLFKHDDLGRAVEVLEAAGHSVSNPNG